MSDEMNRDYQEETDTEAGQDEAAAEKTEVEETEVEETEVEEETSETDRQTEGEPGSDKENGEMEVAVRQEKKASKKKLKADKKNDAMKEKIEELEDRVKRQMAEFENFRKRTEREKSAMFETGAKSVIEKILPVVDNFERGLAAIPEEDKETPFAEGMEMIYKQLMQELEKMDVKPILAVGEEFDPEFHNAVMQVESEEYESGIVAQELQKGYTYRDSVVRHSMVAVTV